jgi:hypothetical protein
MSSKDAFEAIKSRFSSNHVPGTMPSLLIFLPVHRMKVQKNVVALVQESCESEQNSLSYDFFKTRCSGA